MPTHYPAPRVGTIACHPTQLYEDLEIFVPMQGLVDIAKESARLSQDLQRTEAKLQLVKRNHPT